nr:uncharacterized protein CFP56_37870 [Quercus suber]
MGEMPGAFVKAFNFGSLMEEDDVFDGEGGEDDSQIRKGWVTVKLTKDTKRCIRGEQFISIRPWEPFCKLSTANVSLIAVWIRLFELPIELYEAEVLKEIGESIGKVLRINSHTAMEARGKYARLCIQIDINEPLVNTILIGHFEQPVSYEGIQNLCFSCGRLGHKVEACPYTIRKGKEQVVSDEEGLAS